MSVPAKDFSLVWNQAASVAEVAKHFAMKPRTVIQRACHLRKKGHKLKAMPRPLGKDAPGGRPKAAKVKARVSATALANGTTSATIPVSILDALGDQIVQLALQRLQERLAFKA